MINRIFDVFISIAFITIYIIGHYEFSLLIPITILINILCISFGFYVSTVNKKRTPVAYLKLKRYNSLDSEHPKESLSVQFVLHKSS